MHKIKFGAKDTARFNINRFLRELGIQDPSKDEAKEKLISILGGRGQAKEFERFITYMKAVLIHQ